MSIMAEYLLLILVMNVFSLTKQQGLAPPTLTAVPSVITETDRVNLICRPPRSVSVSRCYFYTTDGQNWSSSSCVQSVRGSDLLTLNQRPPVQVKVQCFYVKEWGQTVSTSDHSDQTSVTVQLQTFMSKYYPNQLHVTTAPSDPVKTTDPKHEPGSDSEAVRPVDTTKVRHTHVTTAPFNTVKTTDPKCETKGSNPAIVQWLFVSSACGLVMGSVLTILGFFCSKRIKDKRTIRVSRGTDPGSRTEDKGTIQIEDGYEEMEETYMPLNKTSDVYSSIETEIPLENIHLSTV